MDLRVCGHCEKVHGTGTTCPGCGAPLALADGTFFLGKEFGKYRVERLLGSGGMGVVYGARHTTLNRPAALKLVQPGTADEAFLKRFLREAQVLAELKHPNIVEVYDFDVSPWGPPYYIMEYLEGRTLREIINRRGRDLTLADYAPLLRDLEAALSYAHQKGVIHRDLKPENIFAAAYGDRVVGKVLDFGIAKLLSEGSESTHLTASGAVMGTPNYLAPEQILLQPVGPATDQYAMALVVAEMVTGHAVRAGKSLGEICSVEIRHPLPLVWPGRPDLGEGMRSALHRATQPDPAARFPDVRSFVEALGLPPPGEPTGRLAEAAREGVAEGTLEITPPATARPLIGPTPHPATVDLPVTPAPRTWTGTPGPTKASAPAAPPAPAPAASPRPRRGLLLWVGGGLLALLAVLVLGPRLLGPERRSPGAPTAATPPSRPLLEPTGRIPLPADARGWLAYTLDEEVHVVAGPECVYLIKADTPATRVPLDRGQEALGGLGDGRVWLRQDDALVLRDFVRGRSEVRARPLPPARDILLSPSGARMALLSERSASAYSIGGGVLHRLGGPWELPESPGRAVLGEHHLIVQAGQTLAAYDLDSGRLLWSQPLPELGVKCLALEEARGLVAAGGLFDKVYLYELFRGGERSSLPRQGETWGLAFLPDSPTLVLSGDEGLKLWREGVAGFVTESGSGADQFGSLAFTGSALVVRDAKDKDLRLFAYRGLPPAQSIPTGPKELWALAAAPDGTHLFAGSSDGLLWSVDPQQGVATPHALHTQGLTALVASPDKVASSSDDKTIAIWQPPAMSVLWRSKAHDYLINGLCLAGEPPSLWSASSDGTLKRWAWPQLEVQESIDTKTLFGRGHTLAALWASPDGTHVLAGTWDSALLDLRRGEGGRWTGKLLEVPSQCLYSASGLPAVRAVLFGGLGGERAAVYLYDLDRGELSPIEDLGVPLYNAYTAAAPDGREACVAGAGALLHYSFARGPDGRLRYGVRAALDTDLGAAVSAAWLAGRERLVAGDSSGHVHLFALGDLRGEPRYRSTLPGGR